jgi:hypothetical protein
MSDYRILGRDTSLRLTKNGVWMSETTAIKNIDVKPVVTLLSEGFLGEAAKRHVEIFDEVDVSFSVEPEGKQIFQTQYAIYQRARSGGVQNLQINLGFRLLFPSGTIVKLTVPDLKFGNIGDISNSSREAFVAMSFSAKATKYIPSFT